jgi:short-subunit dehydrogenase
MASPPRPLSGVAVVTGGGRGIGRAIARALHGEGVRVAVADVDGPAAEQVADELGDGALGLALDVTDRPAFTAALDEVERRLGPLTIMVNNAGIMPVGSFEEESDATSTRQLELNLHAVLHGAKEAVRRMRPRGEGHVVNMASIAGKAGAPGAVTYSATKHGVVGLSEALRAELRGTGVRVSVVMPAFVETELSAGTGNLRGLRRATPEEVAAAVVDALRTGRFEVYVPRALKTLVALVAVMPRGLAEALARQLNSGVLLRADRAARAAYEARAAASTPALEAERLPPAPEARPGEEQRAA